MKNWMGKQLTPAEAELVSCYEMLLGIVKEHGSKQGGLPPFAQRNALKALACLWQIANGLDMDPDQLYDVGA
jgi:hypothetical protein